MNDVLQYILYPLLTLALALPLGHYIAKVFREERTFLSPVLDPLERGLVRLLRLPVGEEMRPRQYFGALAAFSLIGLAFVYLLQRLQGWLPLNPQGLPGVAPSLAFNTAASFVSNTNWQAYNGEQTLSYLTQTLGLAVQNFLSAAVGLAVLFALIRGFTRHEAKGIGNFWKDLVKGLLQVLLPLNLVLALLLVAGGVVQSWAPAKEVPLVEPLVVNAAGEVIPGAQLAADGRILDAAGQPYQGWRLGSDGCTVLDAQGQPVQGAKVVREQVLPQGPAAGQVAIKQSGTNGGGFFGTNSAHPLENPSPFTNLIELISILLLPMALCFAFGEAIRRPRQGWALFLAMAILLVLALGAVAVFEGQALEGKELRFGPAASLTWTVFTTAASNGSVNSMLDSYSALGGMVPLVLIQLGGVVFGGVGCGLYGMLAFAILTVFIAGLMVGRTPEFLGKKIEPFEMKWAAVATLTTPATILIGSGLAAVWPGIAGRLGNSGAHGFTELLYAYSSAGGNNGSAFAGLAADWPFLNVTLALVMLTARFLPIFAVLAMAGSLAAKRETATSAGTLSTTGPLFVFLLVFVLLLIGALSFFPALALGPLAEYFA